MSLTYTTYVDQVANIMAVDSTTSQFQTMLPGMIDYAEQRIYRELDLLNTVTRDSTLSLTSNNRNFALPVTANGIFITVQGINVITPAGNVPETGTRNALQPTTRDFLDTVWNSPGGAAVPKYFAMIDQTDIIVGPWPDDTYNVEVIGTIRPNPLTQSNSSTFLTQYLPDVFLAASLIFAFGYMRDYGGMSDNPQSAQSWENQYQNLIKSANAEELRKKWAGPGWQSLSAVAPIPNR